MDWIESITQFCKTTMYGPCVKQIKVTPDFYECLKAKCIKEIINMDLPQGVISQFTGIPIIVDNTLKNPYELVYSKENEYD